MGSPRVWRWTLLAVFAILVVTALWCGYRAYQVYSNLDAAVDDATRLQQAVGSDDTAERDAAVDALREHASEAADLTDGPTWGFVSALPVVGDDAQGLRTVSGVLDDLSTDAVDPLLEAATDLEGILPKDGQVPIEQVEALQEPIGQAATSLATASEQLGAEDTTGYDERLKTKYRDLEARVNDLSAAMSSAETALDVMPSMLGADGPKSYLLVFQNNAEVRATGGLPGAVSLIQSDDGRLQITRQVAASGIDATAEPILPPTEAEAELFGPQLGRFFIDANFTPDFPRVAELMQAQWENAYPSDQIDGVLSIDPVALSYLLEATGPIEAGGVQLTSDNVVDELLSNTYARLPQPSAQDAFFADVAGAGFDTVTAGAAKPTVLVQGLARSAGEHRIYVHSFDPAVQDELAGTAVAGELVTDPSAPPQVGVTLNDATGAKMSYYLRHEVEVDATSCTGGVQQMTGRAKLSSVVTQAEADDLPDYVTGGGAFGTDPGFQLVFMRIYGPVDGEIDDVTIAGRPVKPNYIDQDGRPVGLLVLQIGPEETVDVTWTMTSGEGQEGDVQVDVTPGVEREDASSVARGEC